MPLRSLKNISFLMYAFLLCLVLFSCRKGDAEIVSGPIISPRVLGEPEISNESDPLTFAIVFPLMHQFFSETNRGAREAADSLGVNVILLGPPSFVLEDQIRTMEHLIESGVDGIGIGAFDPEALNPVINRAVEAGIPVVSFDTDAPDSKRLSFISTDNKAQGRFLGRITAKTLKGRGKVIISQGVPVQLNLNQRLEGVREILDNYPDIEIAMVNSGYGQSDKTVESIELMIETHPDFDALIGLDAQAGPSAVVVWRSRGLEKALIVSEDLPETIKGIRDGIVTSTITQEQYLWGTLIIRRLYEVVTRGAVLDEYEITSTREINQGNVDEFY